MSKYYVVLLLLAHIVGDFYLQCDFIAEKKRQGFRWLVLHGFMYYLGVIMVFASVMSRQVFVHSTLLSILHFLVDTLKYFLTTSRGSFREKESSKVFILDQLTHLASIIVVAYMFTANGNKIQMLGYMKDIVERIGLTVITLKMLLTWVTALLLIHKPVNILISRVLVPYKPISKSSLRDDRQAGRLIGTIERVVIITLISLGQYSTIGLVLTAKSVARYDMISKDPGFSEYYLLGTLLSALSVIAISILVSKFKLVF